MVISLNAVCFLSLATRLVPDVNTSIGKEVCNLRKTIQAIPIDVITYGILANRELCVTDLNLPKAFLDSNKKEDIGKYSKDNLPCKCTNENAIMSIQYIESNMCSMNLTVYEGSAEGIIYLKHILQTSRLRSYNKNVRRP